MIKVAKVTIIGVIHGINNIDTHSWRLIWLQKLLTARYAYSRDQHYTIYTTISPGWSANSLVTGWLHWISSSLEWTTLELIFTWVDPYSSYKFAFSGRNDLTKTTIQVLTEYLVTHHGVTHSIASDEETKFTERCNSGSQSCVSLVLPSSPTSWSSCHDKKME